MGISIRSNILSARVLRYLDASSARLSRSFANLSSGSRINRASDDAAGLAIADTLRVRSRVYNQGIRNANDGISLLNVAQGAVSELSSVATRLKELAEQSANGTYSATQRVALDGESRQLVLEMNRILGSTTFNGLNLLNRSLSSVRIQTDYGEEGSIGFQITRSLDRAQGTGYGANASSNGVIFDVKPIIADVDGDGANDLIYGDTNDAGVFVQYGLGDGTFTGGTIYASTATFGGEIGAGDIDGDGDIDLFHSSAGNTYILRNDGGRSFSQSQIVATGNVQSYAVGDVNGDGRPDLIAGTGSTVRVLLGQSDGTLAAGTTYTLGGTVREVALGDMNGDGQLDIVAGANTAGGGVFVLQGSTSGTFTTTQISTTLTATVALGDVDRDGKLDIAIGIAGSGSILKNDGGLNFSTGQSFTFSGAASTFLKFGDINSDGELDLIAQTSGFIDAYTGNGEGAFTSFHTGTTGGGGAGFALGDLNGDDVEDIYLADGSYRVRFNTTQTVTTVKQLDLTTQAGAREALDSITELLDALAMAQGDIGSTQARIHTAIANLTSSALNFDAAEGRIRDVDVADASASLAKEAILQSVSASLLAQANQFPALALQLLAV